MNKLILKPKNYFSILRSTINPRISTKSSLSLNSKLKPKLLPSKLQSSIVREWTNHANWTINSNLGNSNTENVVKKLICNQLESVADLAQNCSGSSDPTLAYFRELYQSGTELDHFVRGQSTLLLATSLVIEPNEQKHDPKFLEQQILLSKLTEFTHLAFVLHHKIIDSKENVDNNSIKQHNKIIAILGDYLISDVYFNLAQMNESVALLDQFGTLWRDLSEGLFSNRENETFKKFASIFAHSFKSAVILSFGNETSQNSAFELGKNFGFYLKAIQDAENGFEIVDERIMKIFKKNALTNLDKLELNEQAKQCFHKLFDVKIY